MQSSCLAIQEHEDEVAYEVVAGPDVGVTGVFSGRAIVGRSCEATISLTDPKVAREHLEITRVGDDIRVEGLTDPCAIRVGGATVERCVLDQAGGVLVIGGTRLRLSTPVRRDSCIASRSSPFERVFGTSSAMRARYPLLRQVAPTRLPVLIEGETGTGKTLLARTIHESSGTLGSPLVTVDCGALLEGPEGVRQLFGEDGERRHQGLLESASGGTFVFENVELLPITLQSMLLRVLDREELAPLHGAPRRVDVRLICTTSVDLRTPIAQGRFREDFYFRLAMVRVQMPTLRDRFEDYRPLVDQFLAELPIDLARARDMSDEAIDLLMERAYPGNIRELRAIVHALAMTARGEVIEPIDVMAGSTCGAPDSVQGEAQATGRTILPFKEAKQRVVEAFEKAYLERLAAMVETNAGALELTQLTPNALRSLRQRASTS